MPNTDDYAKLMRYQRQVIFQGLGLDGQKKLRAGKALIVGVGGLGSWCAEILTRAGVGYLRLADDDKVDLSNLHRQALYLEPDAAAGEAKVLCAQRRLARVNSETRVHAHAERLDRANIATLAADVQVVIDGTDNFPTRYLINDYCIKHGIPWIFAGVVGSEAQTMTIMPGGKPCLRCVLEAPPPPCVEPTCRSAGVLGPAVMAVAAMQAAEAMKILAGRADAVSPYLTKIDLWTNAWQRLDARTASADADCLCCKHHQYEYLDG